MFLDAQRYEVEENFQYGEIKSITYDKKDGLCFDIELTTEVIVGVDIEQIITIGKKNETITRTAYEKEIKKEKKIIKEKELNWILDEESKEEIRKYILTNYTKASDKKELFNSLFEIDSFEDHEIFEIDSFGDHEIYTTLNNDFGLLYFIRITEINELEKNFNNEIRLDMLRSNTNKPLSEFFYQIIFNPNNSFEQKIYLFTLDNKKELKKLNKNIYIDISRTVLPGNVIKKYIDFKTFIKNIYSQIEELEKSNSTKVYISFEKNYSKSYSKEDLLKLNEDEVKEIEKNFFNKINVTIKEKLITSKEEQKTTNIRKV